MLPGYSFSSGQLEVQSELQVIGTSPVSRCLRTVQDDRSRLLTDPSPAACGVSIFIDWLAQILTCS